MITEISDEKWEQIKHVTTELLESQTVSVTDEEVHQAVKDVWDMLGWPLPQIHIVPSPRAAKLLAAELGGDPKIPLKDRIASELVFDSGWDESYLGWLLGGQIAGVKFDAEKLRVYQNWCRACPFLAGLGNVLCVSRRPIEIHWRNKVLHNDSGPSVLWADGFALYSLGGKRVDEQLVMAPETQTLEQIEGEKDNDLRAIRLERYGVDKYLLETGASVIDERTNDVEGTHEALLRDRKGRVFIWPTCPSGKPCPPMRVPDTITDCASAQFWLGGENKELNVLFRT